MQYLRIPLVLLSVLMFALPARSGEDPPTRTNDRPADDSRLEIMIVVPGAYSVMNDGAAASVTMTRDQIESAPQIGEDLFRALARLPGLTGDEYGAHFSIRGGRHDETLILLDGLEIYEPYHLKDFNEGAISVIDAVNIQAVDLMTGGFPVRYGNRRSGVLNITSRIPEMDQTLYAAGASFMNARAMAMGRFKNGRGSWLAAGRSGYLDLIFNLINQNDLPSPRYHDFFGKMDLNFGPRHRLTIDVLHAGDRYTFDAEATTGFRDSIRTREDATNRYGNSYAWATLHSFPGDRVAVQSMVSAGKVTRTRNGSERYLDDRSPLYAVSNQNDFTVLGVKQDWQLDPASRLNIQFGIDLRRFDVVYENEAEVGQDPNDPASYPPGTYPVLTRDSRQTDGTTLGAYASARLQPLESIAIEGGARYDRSSFTGDKDISPRAGAALDLGGGRTLRLGAGYYRQMQRIQEAAILDGSSGYGKSELSKQLTAGLEQRLPRGAALRLEAYLKNGSHLRDNFRNWKSVLDVFPETNEDRILVHPLDKDSRGLEFYYRGRVGERLRLRAGYTWTKVEETVASIENVNDPDPLQYDSTHPWPQDQRHSFNVDLSYRASDTWVISSAFTYHSGWPGTLEHFVAVDDGHGGTELAIKPIELYGVRLPHYHRLDLRGTRRWRTKRGDFRFFAELVNVTNHANVFGYDYYAEVDSQGNPVLARNEEQWFTILPSLGIAWSTSF